MPNPRDQQQKIIAIIMCILIPVLMIIGVVMYGNYKLSQNPELQTEMEKK